MHPGGQLVLQPVNWVSALVDELADAPAGSIVCARSCRGLCFAAQPQLHTFPCVRVLVVCQCVVLYDTIAAAHRRKIELQGPCRQPEAPSTYTSGSRNGVVHATLSRIWYVHLQLSRRLGSKLRCGKSGHNDDSFLKRPHRLLKASAQGG